MVLLILSFSGIFLFVIYMDYLNKRIDKLENKIGFLQWQTDDVLHDIDVVNRNVIQYCASLKRLEDEKIDAAQNLESLWHDAHEEPQGEYEIICQDEFEHVWLTDWREVVKFPDLDNFDWEEAAKTDRIPTFDRENHALYQMIHNGIFERFHVLMGFENALCALLTDPEEVNELFGALADYKCKLIDKLAEYYKPDIICYHDDWGTQRGLFFSPDIWRELIKPHTKRIVDHVKSKGIKFELHSDGLIKDLVAEIVEDLEVDAIQLMAINDIPSLKKITGDKVVYNVFIDIPKYDILDAAGTLTEENFRESIRKEVTELAQGGFYIPSYILVKPKWLAILEDELDKFRMDIYK